MFYLKIFNARLMDGRVGVTFLFNFFYFPRKRISIIPFLWIYTLYCIMRRKKVGKSSTGKFPPKPPCMILTFYAQLVYTSSLSLDAHWTRLKRPWGLTRGRWGGGVWRRYTSRGRSRTRVRQRLRVGHKWSPRVRSINRRVHIILYACSCISWNFPVVDDPITVSRV